MDAVTGQDQQALHAQLAQAREKLDGRVRDLRAIDGELDGLATESKQHRLLHDVCGALEELARDRRSRTLLGRRARPPAAARITSAACGAAWTSSRSASSEIEERRAGRPRRDRAAAGRHRPDRGRRLRGAGRGGAARTGMDHRAGDRRAFRSRADHAVGARGRGGRAFPQAARASCCCTACCSR